MKKKMLLNGDISAVIADMGHTDMLAIGDCGLPVPDETWKIDLALKKGMPSFLDVLETVLDEMMIEKVVLAAEIKTSSPDMLTAILERVGDVAVEYVSHEDFKQALSNTKAVVRTGECTSYANIILISGVTF